jgi:hypothetical protein
VATKAEVERQLGALMARLDGNEANVRSAIPSRKVLRCQVPDLDTAWYSVVDNGHVSQPSQTPPNGRADITLRWAPTTWSTWWRGGSRSCPRSARARSGWTPASSTCCGLRSLL